MRLTWKDAVTTLFTAGIVAVYIAFLQEAGWPLIASVRGTTAAILVLGFVGGCAFGAVGDGYGKGESSVSKMLIGITTVLGVIALAAGIYALVTASAVMLAVLFGATVALWLTATLRHAFTRAAPPPVLGRDVHEVIDPYTTTNR